MGMPAFACVDDDRHARGDALIAAAGVDYDGHLAAVHPRVGSRCGVGAQLHADVVPLREQRPADIRAVVVPQALLGYRHIAADLPFEKLFYVFQIDDFAEFDYALYGETAPVGKAVRLCGGLLFKQRFAVFPDADDIRVILDYSDEGAFLTGKRGDHYVEDMRSIGKLHLDRAAAGPGLCIRRRLQRRRADAYLP